MSKTAIVCLFAVLAVAAALQVRLNKDFMLGDYEDPYKQKCGSKELNVTIEGVSGAFCSPPCNSDGSCPNGPSGTTAEPECALEVNGSSQPTYCALICQPGSGNGGCPKEAQCQAIDGVGICTYAQ